MLSGGNNVAVNWIGGLSTEAGLLSVEGRDVEVEGGDGSTHCATSRGRLLGAGDLRIVTLDRDNRRLCLLSCWESANRAVFGSGGRDVFSQEPCTYVIGLLEVLHDFPDVLIGSGVFFRSFAVAVNP